MTATELTTFTPDALSSPIAYNGDRRTIIAGSDNSTDTQASKTFGFPYKTSLPLDVNGIPVARQDMNGMFYLLSKMQHYMMAGGRILWSAAERDAIGGYPSGAAVWYNNGSTTTQYISTADNNMSTPGADTNWAEYGSGYLPLSGGTMADSAKIKWFQTELTSSQNGKLTWGDKNIVRSVNSYTADNDGNVDISSTNVIDFSQAITGVDSQTLFPTKGGGGTDQVTIPAGTIGGTHTTTKNCFLSYFVFFSSSQAQGTAKSCYIRIKKPDNTYINVTSTANNELSEHGHIFTFFGPLPAGVTIEFYVANDYATVHHSTYSAWEFPLKSV